MFRIKICGITSVEDALAAVEAEADAIGLNFYEKSPRCITLSQASKISVELDDAVRRIGVFVNANRNQIEKNCDIASLDAVQLHGDESPEFVARVFGRPVIWALRMDDRGLAPIAEGLDACQSAGQLPSAVLVDAASSGRYGGTGETVSWAGLASREELLKGVPLILAGGLTPENVEEAIGTVRPYGVDVASGVEQSPGVKDAEKMRLFVENAKAAFEETVR